MIALRLMTGEALWSPGTGMLRPASGAAVALDKVGRAVEWGAADELTARYPALPVNEGEGVLLPGLVDCHAHLELAALGGMVPGGSGLGAWVSELVRIRGGMQEEELLHAATQAAREMVALGTVAVADVCTSLTTAPILRKVGLSGVSLLEVVGANEEAARASLAHGKNRKEMEPPGGGVDVRLVPHSAYGTTAAAIQSLAPRKDADLGEAADSTLAPYHPDVPPLEGEWRELPIGVRSIHAAEHEDEERWLLEGKGPFAPFLRSKGAEPPGKRTLPYLDELGVLGRETLLVHLVTASEEELRLAKSRGATAVLCPRSNLHIGGRLPDLSAIRRVGIPWVLGTDSLASTPDHDLLGEVRVLAEAFPDVPPGELLAAATLGGATALGLSSHPWVRIPFERFPWGQESFS